MYSFKSDTVNQCATNVVAITVLAACKFPVPGLQLTSVAILQQTPDNRRLRERKILREIRAGKWAWS